jgi:hypothetical protein
MRVRPLLFALVSATVFACSNSNPTITDPGTDSTSGGLRGDAGGLPDAGPPPDAGPLPDAGNPCNTQALPLGVVAAKDTCVSPGTTTVTTASIIPNGCNDVKIFLGDGFNCSGILTGAANAFSGTCSSIQCVSIGLPGTLTCTLASNSPCNIAVCTDSTGTNCP